MRPERDDLAAAAEYICVRLHPQELRTAYVQHLRQRYAWGDVPWDGLIMVALQTLSDGITNVFWGLLIAAVYENYKKPNANIEQLLDKQANMERLLDEQRATVAGLHELISKGPAPEQFS